MKLLANSVTHVHVHVTQPHIGLKSQHLSGVQEHFHYLGFFLLGWDGMGYTVGTGTAALCLGWVGGNYTLLVGM